MRKKLLYVFLLVAILLIIDQLIKIYIKTSFEPGQTKALFGDWFVLHYIENPGMAFGTTFGSGIWHKLALSIFRFIAIGFIVYYLVNPKVATISPIVIQRCKMHQFTARRKAL